MGLSITFVLENKAAFYWCIKTGLQQIISMEHMWNYRRVLFLKKMEVCMTDKSIRQLIGSRRS
jgi:hypothetical protein